jgi:hypothetical protein
VRTISAARTLLETVEDSSVADGGVGTRAAVAVVVVVGACELHVLSLKIYAVQGLFSKLQITGVQVMEDFVLGSAVVVGTGGCGDDRGSGATEGGCVDDTTVRWTACSSRLD